MIQKLKAQIKELEDQIKQIQSECNHPKVCVTYTYLGDETDDYGMFVSAGKHSYFCSLCESKWVE